MDKQRFIHEALCLPSNAIAYHVSQFLAELHPTKTVVEGGDGLFNLEEYARAGNCMLEHRAIVYNQVMTQWVGRRISTPPIINAVMMPYGYTGQGPRPSLNATEQEVVDNSVNAWFAVDWRDHSFDVVIMSWMGMNRPYYHYWIISERREIAKEFIKEVCTWNAELRGEVLVFSGGCWHKDADLFRSIQNSTFDNLILKGDLKQQIREDLTQFFTARETYDTYGIPWKRGILLVGPPGNGKTHATKSIINELKQPCLYVKSFRSEMGTDEDNIRAVFERARKSAPCLLILEDLDAQLTPQNRSFFLNELDGFAANIGIVTVASTNHPERLDPAIVDRPSRFDRKYPFDLPAQSERLAYIQMWNATLKPELRFSEEAAQQISEKTTEFSYAYLKELFLSSMMRWIAKDGQSPMEEIMLGQVDTLREQMVSANALEEQEPPQETPPMGPRRGMWRTVVSHG
jgi:hypothetical protein